MEYLRMGFNEVVGFQWGAELVSGQPEVLCACPVMRREIVPAKWPLASATGLFVSHYEV